MTDSCDQSGPSRAEQLIELGALSMSSLVDGAERSRADSQRLTLLRAPPAVQRVLEICGVDAALPFAIQGPARAPTDHVGGGHPQNSHLSRRR